MKNKKLRLKLWIGYIIISTIILILAILMNIFIKKEILSSIYGFNIYFSYLASIIFLLIGLLIIISYWVNRIVLRYISIAYCSSIALLNLMHLMLYGKPFSFVYLGLFFALAIYFYKQKDIFINKP